MAQAGKTKKTFDGRYEILGIVGRGACSVVYHARYLTAPGSEIAIKVLINKKGQGLNTDRLRKEALAMVSSRHRYVIRLDDFHSVNSLCYLSMEYAPESDLRAYIKKLGGKLPALQAERFLLQIAEATAFMHQSGICHRDIKPDNILIVNPRQARLGDFGVAVLPGEIASIEELEKGVGTMDYMAPEVFEGGACDARSDVYALALSFYEVLGGVNPFADVPLARVLETRKDHRIPPLHEIAPDTRRPLADVIMTALAYDPRRRFPSGQEFLKALLLAKAAEGSETTARPMSSEPRPQVRPESQPQNRLEPRPQVKPASQPQNRLEPRPPQSMPKPPPPPRQPAARVIDFQAPAAEDGHASQSIADQPPRPEPRRADHGAVSEAATRIKKRKRHRRKVRTEGSAPVSLPDEKVGESAPLTEIPDAAPPKPTPAPQRTAINRPGMPPISVVPMPPRQDPHSKQDASSTARLRAEQIQEAEQQAERLRSVDSGRSAEDNPVQERDFAQRPSAAESPRKFDEMGAQRSYGASKMGKIGSSKTGFWTLLLVVLALFTVDFALKSITHRGIAQRAMEIFGLGGAPAPIPAVETDNFQFPALPAGMYSGTITDLIPGETLPLVIIAMAEQNTLVFLAGIEGWSPVSVSSADVDNGKVRVRSNSFVLLLGARNEKGELIGEFSNLLTNGTGTWQAKPVR